MQHILLHLHKHQQVELGLDYMLLQQLMELERQHLQFIRHEKEQDMQLMM